MTAPRALPNNALWAAEDAISLSKQIIKEVKFIADKTSDTEVLKAVVKIAIAASSIDGALTSVMPQKRNDSVASGVKSRSNS